MALTKVIGKGVGNLDELGIGETSPLGKLHVKSADSGATADSGADELVLEGSGHSGLTILSGASSTGSIYFGDSGLNYDGYIAYSQSNRKMSFGTAGGSRAFIDSSGSLFVGRSSQVTNGGVGAVHHFEQVGDAQWAVTTHGDQTNNYGHSVYYATAHDGTGNHFLYCTDTGANRLRIRSDGDVQNHDNAYGSTSDERIKQDIKDANSQWDDIKAVKVRNFKKKDDVRQYGDKAWEQIGVVAQELEAAGMTKLITEAPPDEHDIKSSAEFGTLNEDGTIKEVKAKVKDVKYSVLYMKAVKALQEAMIRIETLETKVAALEAK
tara:strand:+ start:40 stop:1005 length:966 start_codon:yes stop_codon:yes gene_type:complete